MMWSRLKNMRCPNCNGYIAENNITIGFECGKCSMFISKEKFNNLLDSLYKGKVVDDYKPDSNMEALNNL